MAPTTQTVTLQYLEWQDLYNVEKPFEILMDIPETMPEVRRSNLKFKPVEGQVVHGIRGKEQEFDFDKHGFQFVEAPTTFTDFKNPVAVDTAYADECKQLLMKNLEGVDRVFFYNWRLREADFDKQKTSVNLNDPTDPVLPAVYPHVDESARGAALQVRKNLKDEAESLLKGRLRLVSIWRPLQRVEDWPVAVCDGRTTKESDLVAADNIRRDFVGENMFAKHNPDFRWYYLPDQGKEEVLLIKIYDSSPEVESRLCLHAAFKLSDPIPNAAPRESIEFRAFVFTNPNK